jgi:hypothetical protein
MQVTLNFFMKNCIAFAALYFAFSLLACQDSKDDFKVVTEDHMIHKSVGREIPFETGMRWIETYNKKNGIQGRLINLGYYVSAENLEAALGSVTDLTGVAFHYGLDSWGVRHIVVIPIGASLSVWANTPGRVFVDANTNTVISQSTAAQWATSYKNAHPTEVWFHYFGKNIFDEIVMIPNFSELDIQPALSDLDLSPQMLLIIWNVPSLFGRTMEGDGGTVYDASNPCPPCPVQ